VLTVRRELGFYEEEYKIPRAICGNGRQQAADRGPPTARSRTSVTVALDIVDRKARRAGDAQGPRCRPKPRCAICAKPRIR